MPVLDLQVSVLIASCLLMAYMTFVQSLPEAILKTSTLHAAAALIAVAAVEDQ